MSFYEMFLMISYFATFVYHILIYHFSILQVFLKKNYTLFSKETVLFLYKIKFSGNRNRFRVQQSMQYYP